MTITNILLFLIFTFQILGLIRLTGLLERVISRLEHIDRGIVEITEDNMRTFFNNKDVLKALDKIKRLLTGKLKGKITDND